MIQNKYFVLAFLLAALLLARLPVLYTSIYKLYDPQELYTGTIAKELIEGPIFPLFDYQALHHKGGTLIAGILAVPFFLLFGQSSFSLKLLAVSFSFATLALWYLFLARFFSKRAALLAGLLFILSPPFYTKFALMSFGMHCESNLFTIMAISVFYQIFFRENPASGALDNKFYYALLGLISGLGMYFDYIFFITLAVCGLFWFILDKRFMLRKTFLLFLVFFMVGFSPWIYYNATHNFKGVCINDTEPDPAPPLRGLLASHTPLESLNKFVDLVTRHIPNSLCFENIKEIKGSVISGLYYLIFIFSFCALTLLNIKIIFENRHKKNSLCPSPSFKSPIPKEALVLTYPALLLIFYSVGPYAVKVIDHELYNFFGYKKLIVLCPFIFVIIALFLDKLWSWKNKNITVAVLFFLPTLFLVSSGLIANYRLVTAANFSNPCIYEGYSYFLLGNMIGKRSGGDISSAIHFANKVKEPYRPLLYQGLGVYWGQMFYRWRPLSECEADIDRIDPKYRPYAFVGVGLLLGSECRFDIPRAERSINDLEKEHRPYAYEGLGKWLGLIYGHRADLFVKQMSPIAKQYQPECYRGAGIMVGSKFGQNVAYCVGLAEKIDPQYRVYYFEGLARHLGWRYRYFLKKNPSDLIRQIPERYRTFFIKGLQEIE